MTKKILAVRLKRISDAKSGFEHKGSVLLNSGLERRDPALKNLFEALFDRGLSYDVHGCGVYWVLVEDEHSIQHYLNINEVELGFDADWFEQEKAKIRGLSGVGYFNACAAMAKEFSIKDQGRTINYRLPERAIA